MNETSTRTQAARAAYKRHYEQIKETMLQVMRVNGSSRAEALYEGKKLHIMVTELIRTAQAVSLNRTYDSAEKIIVDQLEQELVEFFENQIDCILGVI